jgi:glycosyltransferase involved in cell wall biosynthesis
VVVLTGRNEPDFGFNRATRCKPAGPFEYRGVKVIRLEHYIEIVNRGPFLRGLLRALGQLQPDVLFIHDIGPAFITGLWYKLWNPRVRLQVDCHSTSANARNSRFGAIYHGLFKVLFRLFSRRFDRVFAIAPETVDFMCRYYGFDPSELTLLPLPGDPSALPLRESIRSRVRSELRIPAHARVLVHTGKLPGDKETLAVLQAFLLLKDPSLKLLIAGSVEDHFAPTLQHFLQADGRIHALGWVSAARLRELFFASDLLVQPGSLSNTFIDAICCGLPVLLDATPQGSYLTSRGNGSTVARGSIEMLSGAINACIQPASLENLSAAARAASDFFGYANNARMTLDHIDAPVPR